MTSQVTISQKKKKRGLWPVLGFILIIALLIISYAVAPAVIEFCKANFRGFTTRGTNPQTVHLLFTVLIFLVLGAFTALIVALFAPKRAINVKESDLAKERVQMQEQKKMDRLRQRRINREMKDVRRN